jgi:hypothetical protein
MPRYPRREIVRSEPGIYTVRWVGNHAGSVTVRQGTSIRTGKWREADVDLSLGGPMTVREAVRFGKTLAAAVNDAADRNRRFRGRIAPHRSRPRPHGPDGTLTPTVVVRGISKDPVGAMIMAKAIAGKNRPKRGPR